MADEEKRGMFSERYELSRGIEKAKVWSGARFLGNIIKRILTLLITIAIIVVIIIGLIFVFNLIRSGSAQAAITNLEAILSNTPIGKLFGLAFVKSTEPSTLFTGISWQSEVESNKENEDLGVRITKLSSDAQYFSGDPITIVGEIRAATPADITNLNIKCKLKDYTGSTDITPEEITIYKGKVESIKPICKFNEGIATEKDIKSVIATMDILYDFKTRAYLKVYSLSKSQKEAVKDPFEGISEPNLKSDNTISSVTEKGPLNFGIGLESQPLSEGSTFFGVTITNSDYSGNIAELKQITLQLPLGIELSTEKNCAFISTGTTEDGYSTYELTSDALSSFNIDCSSKLFDITEKECILRYKNKKTFLCNIKVTDTPLKTTYIGSILAEAWYTYSTSRDTAVDIYKKQIVS
ncbi:MAG: hypothetical protein AB1571_02805 [Nanoarchaeota archaeon]